MIEKEIITKDLKFYSQKSIGIATFIGGPLAAGYLIRENYLGINKTDEGKKSLLIGILATVLLFAIIFMIPESILDKVPNQILPAIYTGIIFLIVGKIQGPILNKHKENGHVFHSGWRAAGIGFISLIILLIAIFGITFLLPKGQEFEKYDIEMVKFFLNENETLEFYTHLENQSNSVLLQELETSAIPKWKENIEIIKNSNTISNLPFELLEQNKLLLKYSELRLEAFKLFKKAIQEDTDKYAQELNQVHLELEKQLDKLK